MALPNPTPTRLPRPLLNLDTLSPRDQVRIDGTNYDLRTTDMLSVLEHNKVSRLAPRYDELIEREQITDEEAVELSQLLVEMCGLVLSAPAEVQARLTDPQRLLVVSTFSVLSQSTRPSESPNRTAATPAQSTGANKRRASRRRSARTR